METTAQLLEVSLLQIWNDRNAQNRLTLMKDIYAKNIAFYESNEGPAIVGHQAINELISRLQQQWPASFQFELSGQAKVNHQVQQISWRLGEPGAQAAATGSDIASGRWENCFAVLVSCSK
jgi:hypothetical protein